MDPKKIFTIFSCKSYGLNFLDYKYSLTPRQYPIRLTHLELDKLLYIYINTYNHAIPDINLTNLTNTLRKLKERTTHNKICTVQHQRSRITVGRHRNSSLHSASAASRGVSPSASRTPTSAPLASRVSTTSLCPHDAA